MIIQSLKRDKTFNKGEKKRARKIGKDGEEMTLAIETKSKAPRFHPIFHPSTAN
jgi:phosphoribosyl-ATP pyrophosphohydrolase